MSTTNHLQITGSLKVTGSLFSNSERVATPSFFANNQTAALEEDGNGDVQFISGSITGSKFLVDGQFEFDENGDFEVFKRPSKANEPYVTFCGT